MTADRLRNSVGDVDVREYIGLRIHVAQRFKNLFSAAHANEPVVACESCRYRSLLDHNSRSAAAQTAAGWSCPSRIPPGPTASGSPPRSLATIGIPLNCASVTTRPQVSSHWLGTRRILVCRYTARMSDVGSRNTTLPRRRSFRSCSTWADDLEIYTGAVDPAASCAD